MKKILLTFFLCTAAYWASAQEDDPLRQFNENRKRITQTGMLTLGSWAVGNIAVNGVLMSRSSGTPYYFQQMNVFWNLVNLGLAGFGYYNATQIDPAAIGLTETVDEYYSLQKILLFNAGLDIGYMAGGLYLIERARRSGNTDERLRGYGQSVILQGAFLLAFDTILFFILDARADNLLPLLNLSQDGVGMRIRF
ncbi:MAG: DUF6992 family protein [Cyclobacteriaceae bacterium]